MAILWIMAVVLIAAVPILVALLKGVLGAHYAEPGEVIA